MRKPKQKHVPAVAPPVSPASVHQLDRLSLPELKALAYDLISTMEWARGQLALVNQRIAELSQHSASSTGDE